MRIEVLLFLYFMVMVILMIACSLPRRPAPGLSPTLFPAMTLTRYDPQMSTRAAEEAAFKVTIAPPKTGRSDINFSPPSCFRTAAPFLTCLGYVHNSGRKAIGDIKLSARFISAGGEAQGRQAFSLEQRRLEAGAAAPYRFFTPDSRRDAAAIEIALISAEASASDGVRLALLDERGEYLPQEKQYRFSAKLSNSSDESASAIRLIVALEAADGALVGYRVEDLPGELPSGGTTDVDLRLAALGAQAPLRHRVSLEAQPAGHPWLPPYSASDAR